MSFLGKNNFFLQRKITVKGQRRERGGTGKPKENRRKEAKEEPGMDLQDFPGSRARSCRSCDAHHGGKPQKLPQTLD
jgi:hypothetical protein